MKREVLENYSKKQIELNRLEEKIKELRGRLESPKLAAIGRIKGGEKKNFDDYLDDLIRLQEDYNKRAKAIIQEQIRIEQVISSLDDPVSRALLGYRYIDGLEWQQIADKLYYSYVHVVHRLFPKALKCFEEKSEME